VTPDPNTPFRVANDDDRRQERKLHEMLDAAEDVVLDAAVALRRGGVAELEALHAAVDVLLDMRAAVGL